MKDQFVSGEGFPEIEPNEIYFQRLLETIPEICWQPEITADDIRNFEDDQDVREIYESAQLIINAFSKLELAEQSEQWKNLNVKAEELKNNLESKFPDLFSNK